MLDQWFRDLEIELPWEKFRSLPRHPAYRYEYRKGPLRISGNPRYFHCLIDLHGLDSTNAAAPVSQFLCRVITPDDWPRLQMPFADALRTSSPLCHLTRDERLLAAKQTLEQTRSGVDGPLVEAGCFILEHVDQREVVGAILVTLIPSGDLRSFDADKWNETPPEKPVQQRWGQPHLTWIFVRPEWSRRGVGGTLLRQSIERIHALGYGTLASTILLGNYSSMLWHWRMGFELLSHPTSPRRLG